MSETITDVAPADKLRDELIDLIHNRTRDSYGPHIVAAIFGILSVPLDVLAALRSGEMVAVPTVEAPPFKIEAYGAKVATVKNTPEEVLEVLAANDGTYRLIVHNRIGDGDRWDDLSANLSADDLRRIGALAAPSAARKEDGR